MEVLPEFVVRQARSLQEAAHLLEGDADARILAGGTGLIANLKLGVGAPSVLVSLERVPGFRDITESGGVLRLGAGVTLSRLATDAVIGGRIPALATAAATVAGPAHRSAATLGGNLCLDTRCVFYNQSEAWRRSLGYCLKYRGDVCHVAPRGKRCHAAYSGDLAPVLLVLGVEVEIAGPKGLRRAPLAALYCDDGAQHLALARGEFVAAVLVPAPRPGTRVGYRKARVRGAIDFPLAGVAVALETEHGRVRELRVALTGTNPSPLLLDGTGAFRGQAPDAEVLDQLVKLVQRQASPQRTTATSSNYRRQVAAAMARRLVSELAIAD